MNERIRELAKQAGAQGIVNRDFIDIEKFVGLIVEEACRSLNPMLRDMISRGQAVDLIKKHFGVEE